MFFYDPEDFDAPYIGPTLYDDLKRHLALYVSKAELVDMATAHELCRHEPGSMVRRQAERARREQHRQSTTAELASLVLDYIIDTGASLFPDNGFLVDREGENVLWINHHTIGSLLPYPEEDDERYHLDAHDG